MGVEVGGRRFEGGLLGFRGGLGLFQCGLVLRDLRAFLRGVFALSAIGFASCWFVRNCGLFCLSFLLGSVLLCCSRRRRRLLMREGRWIRVQNPFRCLTLLVEVRGLDLIGIRPCGRLLGRLGLTPGLPFG